MYGQVQAGRLAIQVGILILVSQMLFACSSVSDKKHYVTDKPLNMNEQGTVTKAFSAALTPLEDIGLRKREIPSTLKGYAANPYGRVDTDECAAVQKELAQIAALLGPDVDAPKVALSAREEYMETGGNLLSDAVVGVVKSQTDFIPFRGVVRRITGAEANERAVNQAIEAGKLRRAYLRGYSEARFHGRCSPYPTLIPVGKGAVEAQASDPNAIASVAK